MRLVPTEGKTFGAARTVPIEGATVAEPGRKNARTRIGLLVGRSSPRVTSDSYQPISESIAAAVGRIAAHLEDAKTRSAPPGGLRRELRDRRR